ncbi:MAG: hypothetical protein WCP07_13130 [bacterium]|jgi:hypothetical protein
MTQIPEHLKRYFADSNEIRRTVDEANRKMGLPPVETISAEDSRERVRALRQSMRDSGIRAEDNIFTCLLYKMRDGDDEA